MGTMYTIITPAPDNLVTAIAPYRQKYDPQAEKIPPNVTLVRPFSFSGGPKEIDSHLETVTENQAPFKVSLVGWDLYTHKVHWLCLPLIAGSRECVDLRAQLLSGPLQPLAGKDEAYRPHIIIGRFPTRPAFEAERAALRGFEPQFTFRVNGIMLLQRDTAGDPWHPATRYRFKGTVRSGR